jgi:GH25 family lysozyme M1 (1,4-beta-N-acetylmuramidase)
VSYRVYGANLSSSAILHGIDLSHWNKVTDWSKIKTDFIIQKCTQGTGYLDPTYKERKDKIYGSYHFADGGDAIKEADWYLKNCGNEQLVLDWEIEHADPVGWCKKFIGRLKEKGRTCWLYTNDARATKYAWPEDWTYWIARYGVNDGTQSKEPAFKNWSVWQYTSRGKIAGIDGYVDLNIAKQLNKEVMCTKCEELKKKVEKLKLENMELEVDRLNCEEIIPKLTETIENQREVLNTLTEKNAALKQKVEEYEGEQSISTLIGLIIAKIWK